MKTGVEIIAEERQRQVDQEGYSAGHDANHEGGELALVAALYATPIPLYQVHVTDDRKEASPGYRGITLEADDPWPSEWGKEFDKRDKHDRLRQLAIAGALIAAEIDRQLARET